MTLQDLSVASEDVLNTIKSYNLTWINDKLKELAETDNFREEASFKSDNESESTSLNSSSSPSEFNDDDRIESSDAILL
jgi:hypothetical protein